MASYKATVFMRLPAKNFSQRHYTDGDINGKLFAGIFHITRKTLTLGSHTFCCIEITTLLTLYHIFGAINTESRVNIHLDRPKPPTLFCVETTA
jgi:hypothetical protein